MGMLLFLLSGQPRAILGDPGEELWEYLVINSAWRWGTTSEEWTNLHFNMFAAEANTSKLYFKRKPGESTRAHKTKLHLKKMYESQE